MNRLNFKCPEIINFSCIVISHQDYINIPSRVSVVIS